MLLSRRELIKAGRCRRLTAKTVDDEKFRTAAVKFSVRRHHAMLMLMLVLLVLLLQAGVIVASVQQ